MSFLRNSTGERDRKEELTICDNGKEKLNIINQGAMDTVSMPGSSPQSTHDKGY